MQLVKQVKLELKDGRSDKVYEVDLCEVGDDQFVVNFRYGRRGTTLRDGTKTVSPIPRRKAEAAFQKLVGSKLAKGYRDVTDGAATEQAPAQRPRGTEKPASTRQLNARQSALLAELRKAADGARTARPAERLVWRAGEMRLEQAVPSILALVGTGKPLRDYCCAWALGRSGDAQALPKLDELQRDGRDDSIKRIAAESYLALVSGTERERFLDGVAGALPEAIRQALQTTGDLGEALRAALEGPDPARHASLAQVYLVASNDDRLRKALIDWAAAAPARPPSLRPLRHLFKAAEFRADAEFYGVIARRFDLEKAMFSNDGYAFHPGAHIYIGANTWAKYSEIKKPNSRIGFSSKTRRYLRHRTFNTLRRLGELNDPGYAKMAAGVLLAYSDEDGSAPGVSVHYDWEAEAERSMHYDRFGRFWAFNSILYKNSPRYQPNGSRNVWRCKSRYQPGGAPPNVREEAFPDLWDQAPDTLLRLLQESSCRPVHGFAARALRANRGYCDGLSIEALRGLLQKPYRETVELGLEIARRRWDPTAPDLALLFAMLSADLEVAREVGRELAEAAKPQLLADNPTLVAIVTSRHHDIRVWARDLVRGQVLPRPGQALELADRVLAELLDLTTQSDAATLASDVADTLVECFGPQLRTVSLERISDLLRHPLGPVQALAGRILLQHEVRPAELPDDIMTALVDADTAEVRALGIRLLAELPTETLVARKLFLIACCVSSLEDVRESVRLVLARVVDAQPRFAAEMCAELLPYLQQKQRHDGLHESLFAVLTTELAPGLSSLGKNPTLKLLRSRFSEARQLGAILIERNSAAADFDLRELAKLGDNELRSVRERCWQWYLDEVVRVKGEMSDAVRILDSDWDDTRAFAFGYFRDGFADDDWTPEVLVSIADSVRPDVQQFGREMLTRLFREENGPAYLLKLSQHPARDVQLFATNYLERFAAGNRERIAELEGYFRTVLLQVARGRASKDRILQFLHREATSSRETARVAARVLGDVSATIAIGDRARCIEILRDLDAKWGDLDTPLSVVPPTRHPVDGSANAGGAGAV